MTGCTMTKHLKTAIASLAVLVFGFFLSPSVAQAAPGDDIAKEEKASSKDADKVAWAATIQGRFQFTEEQMKMMREKGLRNPQLAIVGKLAEASGKSVDEILVMRKGQGKGWAKIASELGVDPVEVGRAISTTRRLANGESPESVDGKASSEPASIKSPHAPKKKKGAR
jgi:hypothetical protein